jgi:hypothetical protein
MYIHTQCKYCKRDNWHDIAVNALEHRTTYSDGSQTTDYTIIDLEVDESITEEELAASILRELQGHVYNGITTRQLCKILKDNFGVAFRYCCDIVQRLKIELDMYCPDRQHLYYVEARE